MRERAVATIGILAACAACYFAAHHASNVQRARDLSMQRQFKLCAARYAPGAQFEKCIHADHYPKGVK